nr:MAG TPA: YopX protein [Caudoviricetes sp.]
MNNLKFRAWDKANEEMFKIDVIDFFLKGIRVLEHNGNSFFMKFEDVEIMQSTGLKDKNGKEIFIGDIVEFPELYGFYDFEGGLTSVDGLNVASVVKKGNCITLDNFAGKDGFTERELENYECTFDDLDFKNFEIIGNIYENKELLENDR